MPNTSPPDSAPSSAAPKRQLTLFDSTCIIVGIIIGAGVYNTANTIACGVDAGWKLLGLWLIGGVLSLCGAMGYAELATAYPREGGDYVYLTKAYGRWAGFMFGWLQLLVVRPADITGMAFAFATYFMAIYDIGWTVSVPWSEETLSLTPRVYAAIAVATFTAINVAGVSQGKWAQNLLTVVKAIGLLAIVGVALFAPDGSGTAATYKEQHWSLALILVLFSYGGWNEMAYVAAEVKNPNRNIVRALMFGTGAVLAIYLLLNAAFLHMLGQEGMAASEAVAADAVSVVFPGTGSRLISLLVCISALGAVNGLIFTGARISYAVGAEHRAFRVFGQWNERTGTPARSLLIQGAIAIALVLALGTFVKAVLYASTIVYSFYLATTLAVIILRRRDPQAPRPYRVTGYPIPTVIFGVTCAYLIYRAVIYDWKLSVVAIGIVLLSLPVYWLTTPRRAAE